MSRHVAATAIYFKQRSPPLRRRGRPGRRAAPATCAKG